MGRKLSQRQKAKNRADYNRIRRAYEKTDKSVDYKTFKKIVINQAKGTGETIGEAAKKVAHSHAFTTAEQIAKENFLSGLKKKFRDVYDEMRRKMGRFNKGETMMDKIIWDEDKQMYSIVGTSNYVDISNSPSMAYII